MTMASGHVGRFVLPWNGFPVAMSTKDSSSVPVTLAVSSRGKLEKAEKLLAQLDEICFFSCQEYSELQKAIQMYKASHSG